MSIPSLMPADIVLIRHKKSLARRLLRRILNSHWDHAAMILYPKDKATHLEHSVYFESIRDKSFTHWQPRGAALHLLPYYLDHPKKYDVGIKRVPGLSDLERQRVVTYMLTNVDAPYWPWESPMIILAAFFKSLGRRYLENQRFSCSGLIQKAFYDSVEWERKRLVIFKEGLWSPIELQEQVSPADIAASANCVWIHNQH